MLNDQKVAKNLVTSDKRCNCWLLKKGSSDRIRLCVSIYQPTTRWWNRGRNIVGVTYVASFIEFIKKEEYGG
jgi:hypothetical protein